LEGTLIEIFPVSQQGFIVGREIDPREKLLIYHYPNMSRECAVDK
jgi:hypothetical protein